MKTIVIYHSQTGFTKQYAQWIAEAAHGDCVELSQGKKMDLAPYDAIVFGGWACAGSISKLGWFKAHLPQWTDKKCIAFCVGGSPMENPEVAVFLERLFQKEEQVSVFYCPGGFRYERMPAPSKMMMKMFLQVMKAKKDKTDADREMLKMIGSSYDISDKKYIAPILQCLGCEPPA